MDGNTKQQQLLFDKGITNVPSDALCSDNALEESLGMVYDNGEHRVIQTPVVEMSLPTDTFTADILYIHNLNDQKRYIFLKYVRGSDTSLAWGLNDNGTLTSEEAILGIDLTEPDKLLVTSVGKTLVITDPNGIHYFVWKDNSYKSLSTPFPKINFDAYLTYKHYYISEYGWLPEWYVSNSQSTDGITQGNSGNLHIVDGKQNEWNDVAIGLYSKNLKEIAQKKCFAEPFFVRFALELYDGTFTYITTPFLLFPSVTKNSNIRSRVVEEVEMHTTCCKLFVSQLQDYSDYSDIIKDVVVFISDGIRIYDTGVDQPLTLIDNGGVIANNVIRTILNYTSSSYTLGASKYTEQTTGLNYCYKGLKERDEQEIVNEINSTSIFYKLCSLGLKPVQDFDVASKIETHTLENLTSQQRLDADDYYSHCKIIPEFIYSYNARLNVANAKRDFFGGFDKFIAWDNDSSATPVFDTYKIFVTIQTDTDTIVVEHQTESLSNKQGQYFFYPDSRATNVVIKNSSNVKILDAKLTEHKGLNGAYYLCGLPASTPPTPDTSAQGRTVATTLQTENLPNYIITSEVNNPYVFKAEGYYSIGIGKVLAMSSITQAISEGQFGQYPLLAFSDTGIWSLSVASTGYYNSVHPMSREVCNNIKSITQTDGAVFFSSEKGLMIVVGNQVKCVSEQLSGREATTSGVETMGDFRDFLKNGFIAYDYRDSMLWIFKQTSDYCWVYNIKTGTFGKCDFTCDRVVNDYPDAMLSKLSAFSSLLGRPNINLDNTTYSGRIITRPMKLENALALKSIIQIKHIHDMDANATLTLQVYGSNNLKNWVEITSLRGTPWKYFRFRYNFGSMKATDRFSGSVLITQERRTNKLR